MSKLFFVNRQKEIDSFTKIILGHNEIHYPILKITGPTGVGKSLLLQKYHEICIGKNLPVAFVHGNKSRSELDFLVEIANQVEKYAGLFPFREFKAHLRKVYQIHDKLISGKKTSIGKQILNPIKLIGKGAATAASTAIGADILLAAAAEVLGDILFEGIEKQISQLGEYGLNTDEIALLKNLREESLNTFLTGFKKVQNEHPVVVIIDGLEKIHHLENWLVDLFLPRINNGKTLVVISSRINFNPRWTDIASFSQTIELAPFSYKDVREYVKNRGMSVGKKALKELFEATNGLPIGVALWCETSDKPATGTQNFYEDRVAMLASKIDDILSNQIADSKLHNIVRTCAIFRHFDEDLIRYILGIGSDEALLVFSTLRQYNSVFKSHPLGLSTHELLRHHLITSFRQNNYAKFIEVNQKAIEYYEPKIQNMPWSKKGLFAIEYAYHLAIIADDKDLLELFFGEYNSLPVHVTAALQSDLPEILEVDWKAFPHPDNRITMARLEKWYHASPNSFRIAKDEKSKILGYSCILNMKPEATEALLNGSLSFKEITESHLLPNDTTITTVDYMMDSLAIADIKRSDVGAALLRDMFMQVKSSVRYLLSVAVTQYGANVLERTGFKLVRKLPDVVDNFQYAVYLIDPNDKQHNSLFTKILKRYA